MIKIYTTPTCSFCKKAKEYFNKKKIKFQEIDISKDEKARDEAIEKSGQIATPIIDINGTIIVGFNQKKIEENLK